MVDYKILGSVCLKCVLMWFLLQDVFVQRSEYNSG